MNQCWQILVAIRLKLLWYILRARVRPHHFRSLLSSRVCNRLTSSFNNTGSSTPLPCPAGPNPGYLPSAAPAPDWLPSPVPAPDWLPSPVPAPDWLPSPVPAPDWLPSPVQAPDWLPSPVPVPDWLPSAVPGQPQTS